MDAEKTDHVDDDVAKDGPESQNENQSVADASVSKTDECDVASKTTEEGAEPVESDENAENQNTLDGAALDVSASSRKEIGMELRPAKTKGDIRKQLELKKGKVKNSIPEANDSDSIPSPSSKGEQKQMDSSLLKTPKEIPETSVKWTEGEMFWARVNGHPWWPCMIFKDPNNALYTKMWRVNSRAYHFHFFGSSCERGWVTESSMMAYEGKVKFEELRKEKIAQLNSLKTKAKTNKNVRSSLMTFDIKANRLSSWESASDEADKVFQMNLEGRMNYVVELLSKTKKKRRESLDGAKRKREEQGEETAKKKAKKADGSLNSDQKSQGADESKMEDVSEPTEANDEKSMEVDDSAIFNQGSEEPSTSTPSTAQGGKLSNHIEATPERANSTRYKLRAVRKLKKLTDDEQEGEEEEAKKKRKTSVTSATAEGSEKSEDSQAAKVVVAKASTSTAGGDVVTRAQEIFKLTHNCNNYKKEEVCVKCESSHPGVVKCKGPCHAPLHPICAGVEPSEDATEGAAKGDFVCMDCQSGQHACFICKSKEGSTVKCGVSSCCFYYHVECIRRLKHVRFEKNQPICPMHACISCTADAERSHLASRGRFFKCIRCPNAYHTGDFCIAAGSVVLSTTWIICGDHHTPEVRRKDNEPLNAAFCFSCGQGGRLVCCESCPASYHDECCEEKPPETGKWNCELCTDGKRPLYGEIVWCKAGIYRWWPAEVCHPRNIPTNIQNLSHGIGDFPVYFFGSNDYLWTNRGRVFSFQEGDKGTKQGQSKHLLETFHKALEEADLAARVYYEERNRKEQQFLDKKPTPYKQIRFNVPVGDVEASKNPTGEFPRCNCNPLSESPCSPDSDCFNRLMMYECDSLMCSSGDRCCNRLIQLKKEAETEVFRTTDNRGWGLRAKTDLQRGQLVHEYVGDLITQDECKERLRKAKEQNISNFYMLTLDKNRIIDAGPKGNNSRFMNHSCQPNCETQVWYVTGDYRVGLFALQDIKAGEELTFNYNLKCLGDTKTVCNCGTPLCSGFLGEKPKSSPSDDKNSNQKKKRKKSKNAAKQVHEDTCWRCGNPGELVLCDKLNCTKAYHLKCLNLSQLPKGKWICPWHLCDEENCGKWASKLCSMCPNSYCTKHHENNIFILPTGRIICDEHPSTCPQLQYLLEQDRMEQEKKSKESEEKEPQVNGEVKASDAAAALESPFPLVSTPFQKKARGRPPKHPKPVESPIVGSASKPPVVASTSKSPAVGSTSKPRRLKSVSKAKKSSLPLNSEVVETPNSSMAAEEKIPTEEKHKRQGEDKLGTKVVNGSLNEEGMDCTEDNSQSKLEKQESSDPAPTDVDETEDLKNCRGGEPRSSRDEMSQVSTQDDDEEKEEEGDENADSSKSKKQLASALSPEMLDESGAGNPVGDRVPDRSSDSSFPEKISNGFPEKLRGPSPRRSIHASDVNEFNE